MNRLLITASVALAALAAPRAHGLTEPAGLSNALRVRADQVPAFMLTARGAEVYRCSPIDTASGGYGWFVTVPDAILYDGARQAARLASSNHFEAVGDRSSLSTVPIRLQAAGAGNMPWELAAASAEGESGLFVGVTAVQRVNTNGGAAPSSTCDETHSGDEARVDFSADYYFYKPAGAA